MNVIQKDIQMHFFGRKSEVSSRKHSVADMCTTWKAGIPVSNLPGSGEHI